MARSTLSWPPGLSCPSYDRLVGPITQLIRRAYKMERTPLKEFEFNGYETPTCMAVCDSTPANQRFKAGYLAFSKERGRGVLDVALHLLFNYGVEQGTRIEKENSDFWKKKAEFWERHCQEAEAKATRSTELLVELREICKNHGIG